MAEAPVPTVLAMLLCDQVISDAESGKKSLIGIFDRLASAQYPANVNLSVYTKMIDAEGDYELGFRFVRLRDDALIVPEIRMKAKVGNRLEPVEFVANFRGLPVPEASKYEFQLHANGAFQGRVTLEAIRIQPGEVPRWQQPQ